MEVKVYGAAIVEGGSDMGDGGADSGGLRTGELGGTGTG